MHVLLVYMYIIHHRLFGQVGEAGAVCRAHGIYGAHIGFEVQELAGAAAVQPFALAVLIQPLFFKGFNGHAQVGRDAPEVLEIERWRHVPAAVRASEAVYFLPHLPVNFLGNSIQVLGRIVFQFG